MPWSVCRDGGIGRRSGLKIRRGQPLASSSLAPGTKLNQGFVKMAQGRSQTLFCVFFAFYPARERIVASKLNDVEIGAELYAHTVILDRLEKTDAMVPTH